MISAYEFIEWLKVITDRCGGGGVLYEFCFFCGGDEVGFNHESNELDYAHEEDCPYIAALEMMEAYEAAKE
jgi:hypothetical protein